MTRHCHNCGEPWTLNGQPGRGETCMKCRADLRVCLNCAHYDPRAAHQRRERRAEPVLEKHVGNFCEYFEFALREWTPKTGGHPRERAAREQLKKYSAIEIVRRKSSRVCQNADSAFLQMRCKKRAFFRVRLAS